MLVSKLSRDGDTAHVSFSDGTKVLNSLRYGVIEVPACYCTIIIKDDEGQTVRKLSGYAYLSPSDIPDDLRGRKIAFSRAVLGLERPARALLWKDYLSMFSTIKCPGLKRVGVEKKHGSAQIPSF